MAQAGTQTGTIAGFFDTEANAERAIDELVSAGFTRGQIGVALSSGTGTSNQASGTANTVGEHAAEAGEGLWGKIKSFFGGNEAEPYAGEATGNGMSTREVTDDQGYGNGYDDQGYHSDAVHHSLSGLDVHPDRANYLGGRLGNGDEGAVVTVSAADRAAEAETILKRNGADLGDTSSDETSTGTRSLGAPDTTAANKANLMGTDATAADTTATGQQNIKLYGEVLRVHKDRVSRGDVNIRKDVITEMQTIQVPVTREELVIERVAGTGELMPEGASFGGQTIRVPLSEEIASVDKQAFVREQVNIGKREVAGTESFDEQVRHEELNVEDKTVVPAGSATTDRNKV